MDKRKMKKLLILNLPYFLVGLFATNLGEAFVFLEICLQMLCPM